MTLTIKPNTYYRTRDRRKVYVIGIVPRDIDERENPVVGVINKLGLYTWPKNGRFLNNRDHGTDLVSEWVDPVTVTRWVNVYENGDIDGPYLLKDKADDDTKGSRRHRIACVPVTITYAPGDGL